MTDEAFSDPENIILRASAAVLLACAIEQVLPGAKRLACRVTDIGFACDVLFDRPLEEKILFRIDEQMQEIIASDVEVKSVEMLRSNAADYFQYKGQDLRSRTLKQEPGKELVALLSIGDCMEICPLPHIQSLQAVRAFSLQKLFARKGKIEIHGIIAQSRSELKKLVKRHKEAHLFSHLSLGKQMQLFAPCPQGKGWLWYPRGQKIRHLLTEFWQRRCQKIGALQVHTTGKNAHELIYRALLPPLPVCFSELGPAFVEEEECSDLFCCERAVKDKITWIGLKTQLPKALSLFIEEMISSAALFPHCSIFCLLDSSEENAAKQVLEKALHTSELGLTIKKNSEQKARLPTLICMQSDAFGRKWPICSLAVDAGSDELSYFYGSFFISLERTIALLLEQYAGNFPLWLAPEQARLLALGAGPGEYAEGLQEKWTSKGLRVGLDKSNKKLADKVFSAEKAKVPYLIVIGEKEARAKQVTIRPLHTEKEKKTVSPETAAQQLIKASCAVDQ